MKTETTQANDSPIEILMADRSFSNESNGKDMHACVAYNGYVMAYFPHKSGLEFYQSLAASHAELVTALKGAQSALRKSLPHVGSVPDLDPRDDDAHFVGEWLDEINEALLRAKEVQS